MLIVSSASLIVILVLATSPVTAPEIVVETKTEIKTCAGASTILSTKDACYVVDLKTKESKWTIELCAGLNLSAGNIILGAKASVLMCSTLTITGAKDRAEALRAAEDAFKKELAKASTQSDVLKELGQPGPVKAIGPVNLKEDPQMCMEMKTVLINAVKKHP